ncbi:hypothetical protein LINGRAHAP2_LOCUS34796, partial [Linum grandiflorum]
MSVANMVISLVSVVENLVLEVEVVVVIEVPALDIAGVLAMIDMPARVTTHVGGSRLLFDIVALLFAVCKATENLIYVYFRTGTMSPIMILVWSGFTKLVRLLDIVAMSASYHQQLG